MNNKTELAVRSSDGKSGVTSIPFKVDFENINLVTGAKLIVFSVLEHGQHLIWVDRDFAKEELKDGTNYLHLSSPLVISEGKYQVLTVYK